MGTSETQCSSLGAPQRLPWGLPTCYVQGILLAPDPWHQCCSPRWALGQPGVLTTAFWCPCGCVTSSRDTQVTWRLGLSIPFVCCSQSLPAWPGASC